MDNQHIDGVDNIMYHENQLIATVANRQYPELVDYSTKNVPSGTGLERQINK